MRGRGLLALAAAAVAMLSPATAVGGGGRTIAEAPQIPLGQQQVNAVNGIDFYRVALQAGDQLTLRYGPQQQFNWGEVCVFSAWRIGQFRGQRAVLRAQDHRVG